MHLIVYVDIMLVRNSLNFKMPKCLPKMLRQISVFFNYRIFYFFKLYFKFVTAQAFLTVWEGDTFSQKTLVKVSQKQSRNMFSRKPRQACAGQACDQPLLNAVQADKSSKIYVVLTWTEECTCRMEHVACG